jgi:hypothetical protein
LKEARSAAHNAGRRDVQNAKAVQEGLGPPADQV